jgi:hypothetical protein
VYIAAALTRFVYSSVGTPRSISQTRRALPYCRSIRSRKPRNVVLSAVLPGRTS